MTPPNEIDWFEVIASSLYVFVVGAFMVWATVEMGWYAIVWPIVFALGQVINRVETFKLGHLRSGDDE
jgi:cytosine/uracil/thiamine/allantoin permease